MSHLKYAYELGAQAAALQLDVDLEKLAKLRDYVRAGTLATTLGLGGVVGLGAHAVPTMGTTTISRAMAPVNAAKRVPLGLSLDQAERQVGPYYRNSLLRQRAGEAAGAAERDTAYWTQLDRDMRGIADKVNADYLAKNPKWAKKHPGDRMPIMDPGSADQSVGRATARAQAARKLEQDSLATLRDSSALRTVPFDTTHGLSLEEFNFLNRLR